ncbi:MAG: CPBP family intramembrane glutamic endopeptidase [Smithella sp.]
MKKQLVTETENQKGIYPIMSTSKSQYLALPFIVLGTLSLLYFGALAPDAISKLFTMPIVNNAFVDGKLKYQLITLAIALFILFITYLFAKKNAGLFYKAGTLNASAAPVGWLGIKNTDTWNIVGRNFAIIVSVVTGIFIYLNVARGQTLGSEHVRFLPFILLFAMMNAFTEEAITRLSLVTALHGLMPKAVINIASALLFSIPHYFGVPGGVVGALMAAFLGWLLSKSIIETRGMFWAWFIHFLQDVIIFTALFLVAL